MSTGLGVLGKNMFLYCLNNPSCFIDTSGMIAVVDDIAIGFIAIVVLIVVLIFTPPIHISWTTYQSSIFKNSKQDEVDAGKGKSKSLPKQGEPNSDAELIDEKTGEVKQRRHYGEDGNAEYDIDYKHSNGDGTHKFPHTHVWKDGIRLPTNPNESGYFPSVQRRFIYV